MVLYSQNVSFLIQDFVKIQRESFLLFLKTGIPRQLTKRNPFISLSTGIEILFYPASYRLASPDCSIKEAVLKRKTYNCKLYVPAQISDKKKKEITVQWVLLGHLPLMTKRGHFIINGSPRVVVNQLVRSPGIYYQQQIDTKGGAIYYADIIPHRGTWLRLESDKKFRLWAKMKKTPKISLILFLEAFCSTFQDFIYSICKPSPPSLNPRLLYEKESQNHLLLSSPGEYRDKLLKKTGSFSEKITKVDHFLNHRLLAHQVQPKQKKKKINEKEYFKEIESYREQISFLLPSKRNTSLNTVFETIFLETLPNPRTEALTTTEEFRRKRNHLDQVDSISLTPALGRKFMIRKLFNPKTYDLGQTGRKKLNTKLGLLQQKEQLTLTKSDLLLATDYLIRLSLGKGQTDDIDNLKNRRVRTSGELIENQFATGLLRLEKQARKRILTTYIHEVNKGGPTRRPPFRWPGVAIEPPANEEVNQFPLNTLITSKPINGALREFFGGNQLSQYMDQINPLSEITHKRRVSSLGVGGVNRDTAGMDVRGIHPTHYGRICPIETPEGRNAGLVNSLTIFARVHREGYVLTPFYNVFHGQIQNRKRPRFFAVDQEEALRIAPGDLSAASKKFSFLPKRPLPIRKMAEFRRVIRQEIDCMGVSPLQMISVATSLIPFLEHDDANRALMGSNMQRQALPLLIPERPTVRTGLEGRVASDSGHCLQTDLSGIVSYVTATKIAVQKVHLHKLSFPVSL